MPADSAFNQLNHGRIEGMILPLMVAVLIGKELEVGPGRSFAHVSDAIKSAKPGDTVLIYPSPDNYKGEAVRVAIPNITIRGKSKNPVPISGEGFEYSGQGSIPRAIIQVDPEGNGTTIENLDLSGAHNSSFNGAGIRIQAASNVTISNCSIHHNDMGIMSNGREGDTEAASNQVIEYCLIERNGNEKDPGYNHNLYLGGTSVRLFRSEIRNSLTGHNVKSRAHYTRIQECYIHDAANREIDLPESSDTIRPNSNAVIISSRIIKDPQCAGNHGVIQFGQEKGTRNGTLFLLNNIIVTPFASPIVQVTSSTCSVDFQYCTLLNREQSTALIWLSSNPQQKVRLLHNKVSFAYGKQGDTNLTSTTRDDCLGCDPLDYLPKDQSVRANSDGSIVDQKWTAPRTVVWLDGNGLKIQIAAPRISPGAGLSRGL